MTRAALIVALAVGCAAEGLPPTYDTVLQPDSASCDEILREVPRWLDAHRDCHADSDCKLVRTDCGLAYDCGDAFNASASGAYLDALIANWDQRRCVFQCPTCPRGRPRTPTCVAGVCALR